MRSHLITSLRAPDCPMCVPTTDPDGALVAAFLCGGLSRTLFVNGTPDPHVCGRHREIIAATVVRLGGPRRFMTNGQETYQALVRGVRGVEGVH